MQTIPAKLFAVSLALSLLCLVAGTALAGRWEGVLAACILPGMALIFRRRQAQWMPSLLLGLYTVAAAGGMLVGGSSILLLVGLAAALAAWDLDHSIRSLAGNAKTGFGRAQQNQRLLFLAAAMVVSLALTSLGLLLHFSLPFGAMLFLASAALGGMSLLAHFLQKKT